VGVAAVGAVIDSNTVQTGARSGTGQPGGWVGIYLAIQLGRETSTGTAAGGRPSVMSDRIAWAEMKERRWAMAFVVALSGCLAACGGGRHGLSSKATTATVGEESAHANLWVSPPGGRCTRRPTPGPEIATQDCGSFEAAYQVAQCGDVVNIDAGDYGASQSLVDRPALDVCARPVEFRAAAGAPRSSIVLDQLSAGTGTQANTNGASNWTLQGITVRSTINLYPPSRNITIDDVQGGTLTIFATTDLTVENSNWGPCYNLISLTSGKNANGQPAPTYSPNPAITCNASIKIGGSWTQANGAVYHLNRLTIRHNVIHDFIDDNSNPYYDHFECMFIDGGANITIDSNKFYDCQIYSIFLQPFSGYPITNLTIQNNWFWANQDLEGSCASNGSCSAAKPRSSALDFGEETSSDVKNVLVRFNSFDPQDGIVVDGTPPDSASGVRFIGNIIGNSGYGQCIAGASYSYNVWLTQDAPHPGTCGPRDIEESTAPFAARGNSGFTLSDLSLRCGSRARGFVKPNNADYQLDYDIDGKPRNPNGPRDAGAVERNC
jgi:hypothetical protein